MVCHIITSRHIAFIILAEGKKIIITYDCQIKVTLLITHPCHKIDERGQKIIKEKERECIVFNLFILAKVIKRILSKKRSFIFILYC